MMQYTNVVIVRHISTSYANLGGYCKIGKAAFNHCYEVLSSTATLLTTERGCNLLRSGPLSLPPNGISEALRFWEMERWVKGTLRGGRDRQIPSYHSIYFTYWGDLSTSMYSKKIPRGCILTMGEIQERMGVIGRRDMVEGETPGCEHNTPFALLMGWHQEDNKKMLQASFNVTNLDRSIRHYKNCFEMNLLRKENDTEVQGIKAIMGYEPEVHNLVCTIISNGGTVRRYPEPVKEGSLFSASAVDPDGYKFELLQRGATRERICQLMLHVTDITLAIDFYEKALGMQLLTMNRVFNGQVTIGTNDVRRTAEAIAVAIKDIGGQIIEEPGLMPVVKVEMMLFIDPHGWKVTVVNKRDFLRERP
ncbi:lactoylglutathione lyase [Panicum miliaceum]|uniref:Lactoylglutathione lyase n=1 Tax=Panicum miliaceum TaxID=4540 RepID=A0A3L6TLZ5_PANMI|nr:lactoylglutathione lyase [Panicum miliaceum]